MEQIFKSLKGLVSPRLVFGISKILDENEVNVSKAISSIFAGFLVALQKNGVTSQIKNIFDEAGNLDILADTKDICHEKFTREQQDLGDSFLQHLLGDRAADFTNPIAEDSGISKVAANRLISILAPIFVGYVGDKLVDNRWSIHKLLDEISNQKNIFREFVPEQWLD